MNVKLTVHFMPWEVDNALLLFTQLKKSYYYLPKDINVTVESVLNLSSKFVDWKESKLPKEYFISKYDTISLLLGNYNHIKRVYDGDEVYGYLNLQRESLSKETDYYIGVCPDFYFSEHLLYLLLECTKYVNNEYFMITPQIYKKWDHTWDEITNPNYLSVNYNDWDNYDVYQIRHELKQSDQAVELYPTRNSKWAWWFDLYNKAFYEDLCPVHDDWKGYGPWDWYSLMLSEHCKNQGIDFQQYVLRGQTILDMSTGPLKDTGLVKHYKDFLKLLPEYTPSVQRKVFESKMNVFLNKGVEMLKQKHILK